MTPELDFNTLFRQYYSRAFRLAYFMTNDKTLSDDIVQEAFLIVYNKINTLRDKGKFRFWLNKIVINCTNQILRTNSKYYLTDNIEIIANKFTNEECYDPLNIIEENELNNEILKFIQQLGKLEREIFILRYYEEYSYKEIAETLGINESTARSIIHRGKKVLVHYIKNYESGYAEKVGDVL
ncbi:sigma-70 family RNA polymerase sigma factor [Thermanaerosceptrum fracticalcis]|uniref:Sigma-70 family RNA polymerase sigma factor n=1 Tax=Thermanaerosceptrum fracticalcis TaxID=1712410 RepID=A0A7G6E5N0_THEFR|nr:RNA polymerase sigma factor [Thermanaerosceptrum fracticalcis]QNB47384.1 sigma-70 family RNA polymerase sigma factor [Thermanaerosceptrum fracticalcis]